MNARYGYILLILLAIVCAGCGTVASPTSTPSSPANALRARPTPGSGGSTSTTNTTTARSGDIVLTSSLDDSGCATDSVTTFETTDAIYVVLRASSVEEGTSFFARLYDANVALEDTEEVVADQEYDDVCVNFEFVPARGTTWTAGAYEIEFFVNGNSYQFIDFEIR
jgi:hypothetical protein